LYTVNFAFIVFFFLKRKKYSNIQISEIDTYCGCPSPKLIPALKFRSDFRREQRMSSIMTAFVIV